MIDQKNESITEEYLDLQDDEIDELKKQIQLLSSNTKKLLSSNERFSRQVKNQRENFSKRFDSIMSDVNFLRDSDEILINEVEDYSDPIQKIISIKTDHNFKGKKIKTLDKWWEIHFNTGQKDDGRIYFKRQDNILSVLVSFKKNQSQDIRILNRY